MKWGIYIDPKTKETRLLPYNSGCGIDLPLHFQGAIPARHVFQQIIERLTTSVSSQICVERLKAVGIDWKVQSFNKACKAVNDYIFAPFAQLTISDTTSIIPLDKPDEVDLPDNYQESELTVQDQVVPIWSDPSASDRYYLIYALNTRTGQEDLYQYDSEDGTYQYFEVPAPAEEEEAAPALPGAAGASAFSTASFIFFSSSSGCTGLAM